MKYALCTILFAFSVCAVYSQDLLFTGQLMNRQLTNPACAGQLANYRASLAYRTQWASISSPFKTVAASIEFSPGARKKNNPSGFGFGLNINSQNIGQPSLKIINVEGIVNYRLALNNSSSLSIGLSTAFDQRNFNTEGGKWASQFNGYFYDPGISSGESFPSDSESSMELGAGAEYTIQLTPNSSRKKSGSKITIGASAKHAGRMKLSESQYLSNELKSRYDLYAVADISTGKMSGIVPTLFTHFQGGSKRIMPGVFYKQVLVSGTSFIYDVKQSALYVGVLYELNRAFIAQAYLEWGKYQIGLAYEFDSSDLREYSSGKRAFELNFSYAWNRNKHR